MAITRNQHSVPPTRTPDIVHLMVDPIVYRNSKIPTVLTYCSRWFLQGSLIQDVEFTTCEKCLENYEKENV